MDKKKVAFICVHNSCRSQIAEALGKHLAGDKFDFYSAGTETKSQINQDAVRLMKQLYGIDMEQSQYSKTIVMSVVPISVERLMIIGDFPIRRAKVMNVLYRSLREYLKK